MKALKNILVLTMLCLLMVSCRKEECDCINCDEQVVISPDEYLNAPADHLVINSVKISGDCLQINFSSGGCSGDTWEIKLIDQGGILKTNPPQRNLRLSLKNEELCDAWFSREISYDISPLQVNGGKVFLNITNSGDQLLYEYK